ncbi:MAG: gliding motility-associated C-terminal domain-containing protein [Cyclobacteriaceae bacterium]|nr:gliding motility-associated C-terminal domain-containing protein [Cyclobacteriaceae bacterium]
MLKWNREKYLALLPALLWGHIFLYAQSDPGLAFIENKNQWPTSVDFSARVPGGRMMIEPGKFNYYLVDEKRLEELHEQSHHVPTESGGNIEPAITINGHAVEVTFIGANRSSIPMPFGKSTTYYNYFLGDDPDQWAAQAYAYDGFYYNDFYPGINLKIYSFGSDAKYDFILAPYADPTQILIHYSGATNLELENGNLYVHTSLGDIIERKPLSYQFIDGKKVNIESEYKLVGNQLSFCFPKGYDPCYELIIDPLLIFSTYSGSTADNWGSTATPGEKGNLYSAGVTNQISFGGTFPTTAGAFQTTYGGLYDIGILKYDSSGRQLLYATYLGGNNSESPHSLVMNPQGDLIVLGTTSSDDFPTTVGAYDRTFNGGQFVSHVVEYTHGADIFVARIKRDGTQLLGSTFVGGSQNDGLNPNGGALTKNYGDQLRGDVITDANGNIYVSSVTASANFPATKGVDSIYNGGSTDAIVFKLNFDLSQLLWSTFLGGNGTDASHTIKLDKEQNIYVAGGTTSPEFPITTNTYQTQYKLGADGWIAKIANTGDSIHYSTFTGTSGFDQIYFLDINEAAEVYVYGQTNGTFPVTPGVYSNPNSGQFVQKFDNTLSTLIFSTVFGSGRGLPDISPTAFLVNECNNLYLSGWGGIVNSQTGNWPTNTVGMPVSDDAFQKTTSGSDFYFIVLTDDGSQRLYATFLGGTQSRTHVDGGTSRFDKGGIVYHAVCSGCDAFNATGNPTSDFPTTEGAWSRLNRSQNCNNAAFKFDLSSLKARLQTNSVRLDMPGLNKVCLPDKIVFQNFSTGGETYFWDLGDNTRIVKTDTSRITHAYQLPGRYTVWLKAVDEGTCRVKDSTSAVVDVFLAEAEVQDDDQLCEGDQYTLRASGGASYHWISKDKTFQSDAQNPQVSPRDTTIYYVTITESTGCVNQDTVQLNVVPGIGVDFEILREPTCSERPTIALRSVTDSLRNDDIIFFDFGDGTTTDDMETEHAYEADGVYTVRQVASRSVCVYEKTMHVPVFSMKIPNVITPGVQDGKNDTFTIQFGKNSVLTPGDFGFKVSLLVYNRWGTVVFQSDDYDYNWSAEGLAAGVYYYEAIIEEHGVCKSWVQVMK